MKLRPYRKKMARRVNNACDPTEPIDAEAWARLMALSDMLSEERKDSFLALKKRREDARLKIKETQKVLDDHESWLSDQEAKEPCAFDGVPSGTILHVSCPCPRCSPRCTAY